MIFHGWEDTGVPPYGSVNFYKTLIRHGATGNARLYMVPGMPHCRGGSGADSADLLATMSAWVEHGQTPERSKPIAWKAPLGTKPDDLVARSLEHATFSRPLCAYPLVPRYIAGPPNDAKSFQCRASLQGSSRHSSSN
jgi:feruloyl esterase